jgi:hypothetical protein
VSVPEPLSVCCDEASPTGPLCQLASPPNLLDEWCGSDGKDDGDDGSGRVTAPPAGPISEVVMNKLQDPFWTVRGVYGGEDVCLVVEGADPTAAEVFATKRGVQVVFVEQAHRDEVETARLSGMLWRYSPEPKLKCFGTPVTPLQAACLVLCGWATILINLKIFNIKLPIKWQF